jgi:nicotinamide-nucleotide amidase
MQAEILSIGDELLIGQVINTNAAFISQKLNVIGIDVSRVTTVGDNEKEILNAMKSAWQRNDIVIATGGLGPTHDDISKNVVAKFFKKKLILHKKTLAQVKVRFRTFGIKKMPEVNMGQAMIPQGFAALANKKGTAPGLLYSAKGKTFIILPGVPHEMSWLMEEHVLPQLQKNYKRKLQNAILHRNLLTVGIGESTLAEKIGDVNSFLENGATLAYLPRASGVRLRISVRTSSPEAAKQIADRIEKHIRKKASQYIYGKDDDSLAEVVVHLLHRKKAHIATAESCTGGLLSAKLTEVAGLSEVFPGGIISYANEVKKSELGVSAEILKRHGAVSKETAIAMAEGIREKFNTRFALSITGIAGPDGGSKLKPVGTVWIALAEKNKETTARVFQLGKERNIVRERSADSALEMLRRRLLEK